MEVDAAHQLRTQPLRLVRRGDDLAVHHARGGQELLLPDPLRSNIVDELELALAQLDDRIVTALREYGCSVCPQRAVYSR